MIRLRVEWVNPRHPLLADSGADVRVVVDGATATAIAQGTGFREFDIPSTATEFLVFVAFAPHLGAVRQAPAMQVQVFSASQRYVVSDGGNHIEAVPMPPFLQTHPLIDSKIQASAHVAVLAQARTEILDITTAWDNYIQTDGPNQQALEFRTEREQFVDLRALCYTGGQPLIWFASIPVTMSLPTTTRVGVLVFYRPTNYSYTRVDARHSQYPLNRYILSPLPPTAAGTRFWRSDQVARDDRNQWYFWLPCGMERSLSNSRKEVVLLQPWPSGLAYGDAANGRMPVVAEQIVRFLYATEAIALGGFNVSLGRLAISGYSAGGDVLWDSLGANRDRVDEVYSFDANHTANQARRLRRWFQARTDAGRDPRLFFANGLGNNVAAGTAIAAAVTAASHPPPNRVMSLPRLASEYQDGSIPNWVYATLGRTDLRIDPTSLHQFPVYGRYPRVPGEPEADNPTFLQHFLELSGFAGP